MFHIFLKISSRIQRILKLVLDLFKFMLYSITEMEEFAIRHSFTGSHHIYGGKLKSVSQSILLLYGSYFLISKNRFSDIRKYKSFSDIKNSNFWYQWMIFWYQKIKFFISEISYFLISRIWIFDIRKSIFWYKKFRVLFWYQKMILGDRLRPPAGHVPPPHLRACNYES